MRQRHHQSQLKGFPWRVIVYCLVLSYLICDLYLLDGPLRRHIDRARGVDGSARQQQWVARVNGVPITRDQLDLAVRIYNFKRGLSTGNAGPKNLRINRLAALDELIEDELLRTHAGKTPVPVEEAAIQEALQRFRRQFPSEDEFLRQLRLQKLTPGRLRRHIAGYLNQIAWAQANIEDGIRGSEEEVRRWFAENSDQFTVPDLRRARHLFLSTVQEDTPEREALIRELHRRLTAGEDSFEKLAAEFSEDPRSANRGGDLGHFSRHRLPPDFAEKIFALRPGEISAPFRTRLGWHIAEVTETVPAREAAFEEVQAEITALFETRRREAAVDEFIKRLRANSVIDIYPEQLE